MKCIRCQKRYEGLNIDEIDPKRDIFVNRIGKKVLVCKNCQKESEI